MKKKAVVFLNQTEPSVNIRMDAEDMAGCASLQPPQPPFGHKSQPQTSVSNQNLSMGRHLALPG